MLFKFEKETNRVKGLSFHPNRPWLLVSMHNGEIQLWDYQMKTLLEEFKDHEGPVRSVTFHQTQPIFASGSDDYKVKLWNFKQRKCVYTFEGHLDYIRTVNFHHELPWLISASDDQTIRIWNWQSRNCLAIVTGHNHYIMSASFHPREDMIVSASLDSTARVWDFKNLRQKYYEAGKGSDMLLGTDVVVKYILEGHDRGVNWAVFNENSPYIATCADDKTVRLWRYTDSRAWEVETMRGHTGNVSSVIFHTNLELIISNSEDKCLRVWDENKREGVYTLRKENDRFWVLAAHPEENLFAAGHDSGFAVYKIEKERVPVALHRKITFFVSKKVFNCVEEGGIKPMITIKTESKKEAYENNPFLLQANPFNTSELIVLMHFQLDEGTYHLYNFGRNWNSNKQEPSKIQGVSISSCFVSKEKFAILTRSRELMLMDYNNVCKKKISFNSSPEMIFSANVNKILVSEKNSLYLLDTTTSEILGRVSIENAKQVVWSPNLEYVAVFSKFFVSILNRNLDLQSSSPRENKLKTGCWDPCGVFLYSTSTHIKYLLITGDSGIVRSLDSPLYIAQIVQKVVYGISRKGIYVALPVNDIEYKFKLALINKRYNEVRLTLESGGLKGNAIVKYLQDKGFPEIALYFVEDEKTKFNLAIEAGIIEVALNSAYQLNEKECWLKLGIEALRQGNSQIVEMAYEKTRNLDKLSLLYLITGNMSKLAKMQQIAQSRNDKLRIFNNALYRGDIEKRVEMLAEAGQIPLAYLMARTHKLEHMLKPLEQSLGDEGLSMLQDYLNKLHPTKALSPMVPIFNERTGGDQNWPLHQVITSEFEQLKNQSDPANKFAMETEQKPSEERDWGDVGEIEGSWNPDFEFDIEEEEKGAWGETDFEIPDVPETSENRAITTQGVSNTQKWARNCELPGELVAVGAFETAMQILTRTSGVVNFQPLKSLFLEIYTGSSFSLPLLPHISPLEFRLSSNQGTRPRVGVTISLLTNQLKEAYKLTTQGKFSESLVQFVSILHKSLFLSVSSKQEEDEVKDLLKICTEYISCMRLELQRQEELKNNKIPRAVELGYYMSLCRLQPPHQSLTLRSSIALAYKYKNFITCASLCKRFLELVQNSPNVLPQGGDQIIAKHKKLLAYCQQVFTNDLTLGVDLPESAPDIVSIVCMKSFTEVSSAIPTSRCPFCSSLFHKEYKGEICDNCQVSSIGAEAVGFKVFNPLRSN